MFLFDDVLDGDVVECAVSIYGFGFVMVEGICVYFFDLEYCVVFEKLCVWKVLVLFMCVVVVIEGLLFGKSFCVIGVLMRKCEDVHEVIRNVGGMVHDVVKVGTTYLVVGEKVGQIKLDVAKKRGSQVISEEDFYTMIRGE